MFSIIIPLYNKRNFIESTLRSALGQSIANFEIIVVDDGSSDGSSDIVTGTVDKRIRIIKQDNMGVSAARNTGIAAAQYPWLAFLDADDLWGPDHLAMLTLAIERFPDVEFISTQWAFTDKETIEGSIQKLSSIVIQKTSFFRTSVIERDFFHTSGIAVKRTTLDKVGYFGPYRRGEDVELWTRLGLASQCAIVRATTDFRRKDPNGLTSEEFIWSPRQVDIQRRMPTPVLNTLSHILDTPEPLNERHNVELFHDFRLSIGILQATRAIRIWRALQLILLMRKPASLLSHLIMSKRRTVLARSYLDQNNKHTNS